MGTRSQLNVNMNPSLLLELKRAARRKGLTISEFISDLVLQGVSETEEKGSSSHEALRLRVEKLEKELAIVKGACPGQEVIKEVTPFTQQEAENCTVFMRGVFKKFSLEGQFRSQKEAWIDFLPHVECYKQWSPLLSKRLMEVMLFEEPEPWTHEELNEFTNKKITPCPIREGLISWTGLENLPDQQTICKKGQELIKMF